MQSLSRGRPKGSLNRQFDIVDKIETRCKKCQSTARSSYFQREEVCLDRPSTNPSDGTSYNVVVYQKCKCLDCGRGRIDRSLILRAVSHCPKTESDVKNPRSVQIVSHGSERNAILRSVEKHGQECVHRVDP